MELSPDEMKQLINALDLQRKAYDANRAPIDNIIRLRDRLTDELWPKTAPDAP